MRLVFVSDTHDEYDFDVPSGDVLIHCGDFTEHDEIEEYTRFDAWMKSQPHKHRIFIAGNHELSVERIPAMVDNLLPSATYLRDSGCEIGGLKFWGSPWQPWFYDFAFNFPQDDGGEAALATWAQIPPDTDILITHGPPRGILDYIPRKNSNRGCPHLLERVQSVRPLVHAFGHIHVGNGVEKIGQTIFVNSSICDEQHRPWRKPHVIDVVDGAASIVQ